MLRFILSAFLVIGAIVPTHAQETCGAESEDKFDALAKALSEAKSCEAADEKMQQCAWGSSADTQFAAIVIKKCEKPFFDKLTPKAQKRYGEEMQLCAYEYARQEGTMYMSAAALCQVDVAARFAAHPELANQLPSRASFDCNRAQTVLEKAVCSDFSLGHADIVLSRVYSGILKNSDAKDKSTLVQSEKLWLQSIAAKCGLSAPPFSPKSLNCARNEFELRFTTLDSCQESIAACLHDADAEEAATRPGSAPRASFDCEAPSSGLEIVICADAELGQIDIRLAQAYRDTDTIMDAEQHKDLVESERQWLRFVTKTCPLGVVGGIPPVIARSCARDAFETRIEQLQTCSQKGPQKRAGCLNDFHLSGTKQATQ